LPHGSARARRRLRFHPRRHAGRLCWRTFMKILMWIVIAIFVIGLLVVLGLGKLIF
jgi:hypothetical protein